jgi:hypothetical protein
VGTGILVEPGLRIFDMAKKLRPQVGLSVDELCEPVHLQKPGPKKKKAETPGVVETGKEIKRTNQTFLSLKAIGNVDAKGKTILSIGYGGKIVAPPDRGLVLMIKVMEELKHMIDYSSVEAAENDLRLLKEYINGFEITQNKEDDECQKL